MNPMVNKRELFLDEELRCGGFYELCIQVCASSELEPVSSYTNYIWSLPNVEGPYDPSFNKIVIEDKPFIEYQGILNIDNHSIPFKTFNIREDEPIETGFKWFDISFYSEAIEAVFGKEYNTWEDVPKPPESLKKFLLETTSKLYNLHHFKLGLIGFEVSGQYYLEDLKNNLKTMYYTEFYVGKENVHQIASTNSQGVTIIE